MQIISAGVLLQRCPPELQKRVDWTLSAARALRAQANQDARAGRIDQAKKLTAEAEDLQLIAENILLRHAPLPELGIPPVPPHCGRVS